MPTLDKDQRIIFIGKTDYYILIKRLLNDTSKFKILQHDPKFCNLSTFQSYLNTLYKHNE